MTAANTTDYGNDVIRLLTQQHMLYKQLNELAQKQTDLVAGGDPEMLLRILAGRQKLIDRITQIDRELEPIRSDWSRISASLPAAQRQEAADLVEEVQSLLGAILERDARDTQSLSNQKQQVETKIQSASVGKRMHHAYGQSNTAGQSRLFDSHMQ
ncbi:MAG: flagellar export chaperone FlgN [Sedimentisphaerales bacterium]|nr:flagellar export chaperone FlgN [Sedimentisphaerales bacterium]